MNGRDDPSTEIPSAAWLDARRVELEGVVVPDGKPVAVCVVVETESDEKPRRFTISTGDGHPTIAEGDPGDLPTVSLRTTVAVAAAIAGGRLSGGRAFLDGSLRIGGDVALLLDHAPLFEAIARALVARRGTTADA